MTVGILLFASVLGLSDAATAHGGKKAFYALRDVRYQLKVIDPSQKEAVLWEEKYLFENEMSYGKSGETEEIFDGKEMLVLKNGKEVADPAVIAEAKWRRKRNYFLFAYPFKFLDKGFQFQRLESNADPEGTHDVVEITSKAGVGDVSDRFRIFINRKTRFIDQIIYTDMAHHRSEPTLMKCRFEEVSGIRVPVKRVHYPSDWNGKALGAPILEETLENVRFWNGLKSNEFSTNRGLGEPIAK